MRARLLTVSVLCVLLSSALVSPASAAVPTPNRAQLEMLASEASAAPLDMSAFQSDEMYTVSMNGVTMTPTGVASLSSAANPYTRPAWGACNRAAPVATKSVRTFTNRVGNVNIAAGNGFLVCGRHTGGASSNDGYGFMHILIRHGDQGEWGQLAFLAGAASWMDIADFAINSTLRAPQSMSNIQSNDTIAYFAPLQFRDVDDGHVVATYTVVVSVARGSKNIITAFPAGMK